MNTLRMPVEMEQRLDAAIANLDDPDALLTPDLRLIDTELTDDAAGMKMVFSGRREDGKVATFETGSFYDQTDTPPHHICVSTAGGCTRNCTFCSVPDAELGFERLLTAEEVVMQTLYAMARRNPDGSAINVVGLMGNGEPADNLAVIPAVTYLDRYKDVANIFKVSTSTIGENVRNIGRMAAAFSELEMSTILQFSLHAADETKRRKLVPGKLPMDKVLAAIDGYAETTGETVRFNVVLMDGVGESEGFTNASVQDAELLAELLQSPSYASGEELYRALKLSAYNSVPGKPFVAPPKEQIDEFVQTLAKNGITDIQWFTGSGRDINSAQGTGGFSCGQLRATTAVTLGKSQKG